MPYSITISNDFFFFFKLKIYFYVIYESFNEHKLSARVYTYMNVEISAENHFWYCRNEIIFTLFIITSLLWMAYFYFAVVIVCLSFFFYSCAIISPSLVSFYFSTLLYIHRKGVILWSIMRDLCLGNNFRSAHLHIRKEFRMKNLKLADEEKMFSQTYTPILHKSVFRKLYMLSLEI